MGILSILKKKKKLMSGGIYDRFIYSNNHVDIIHDACKICYDTKKELTRETKLEYIGKRVAGGHESILEHSNVVMYFIMEYANSNDLLELIETITLCKYLNVITERVGKEFHILIGGSIRGYKHIFENIKNQDNKFSKIVMNNLYNTNKEYFGTFIEDGIMLEHKFVDLDYTYPALLTNKVLNENINIINMDDIYNIHKETNKVFSIEDLLDFCTITILFEDMSRIISQQATRHRNAITQLSQRYVNYSSDKFNFNSPAKYKDIYDKDHKYAITFNGITSNLNLQELGEMLMGIYGQLNDKSLKDYSLRPEDARAYLPNNAQTSLYITFTFKSLIKFLQLRTDSHAQAEIRILAKTIEESVGSIINTALNIDMYDILIPIYKRMMEDNDLYADIDEVIE